MTVATGCDTVADTARRFQHKPWWEAPGWPGALAAAGPPGEQGGRLLTSLRHHRHGRTSPRVGGNRHEGQFDETPVPRGVTPGTGEQEALGGAVDHDTAGLFPAAPPTQNDRNERRAAPSARVVAGRTALVVGWVVVGGLGLAAFGRWVAWDRLQVLALFDALGALPYVVVWPVLIGALIFRRWVLTAGAVALVAVQLAIGLPEVLAATPVPPWASSPASVHLRLFDGNVKDDNPTMVGYAAQIRSLRPDLVTLEEASPFDLAQLRADGALSGLPYVVNVARYDPFAFIVASRFPLRRPHITVVGGLPAVVTANLVVDGRTLHLMVVHTQAPVGSDWSRWSDDLAEVNRLVQREHGPLLVVGDFNATWGNRGFVQLLSDGLQDGAAARGDPWQMTWSQLTGLVPPLVRIDHVLTAHGPVVTSISTGPGPGSDHRRLLAEVAVPR
jgi:endonuclease/exonuclease/phosphatase (EEP) superfamily protein YafD